MTGDLLLSVGAFLISAQYQRALRWMRRWFRT